MLLQAYNHIKQRKAVVEFHFVEISQRAKQHKKQEVDQSWVREEEEQVFGVVD